MRIILKPFGIATVLVITASLLLLPRLSEKRPLSTPKAPAPVSFTVQSASPDVAAPSPNPRIRSARVALGDASLILDEAKWETYEDPGAAVTRRRVIVTDPPLQNAYRFTIDEPGPRAWSIGYHNRITSTFAAPSRVKVDFWARARRKRDIALVTQMAHSPYTEDSRAVIPLSREWRKYAAELEIHPHEDGEIYLTFLMGQSSSDVFLADIHLKRL